MTQNNRQFRVFAGRGGEVYPIIVEGYCLILYDWLSGVWRAKTVKKKKNKTTNKIQPCTRIIIIIIVIIIVDFTLHVIVSPSLRCPRYRGSCPCVSCTRKCHDNFTLLYSAKTSAQTRYTFMILV